MSERMLIQHCAPPLAGIKTGNMFSCRYESEREMREVLRLFNRRLVKKGLRVLPIRFKNGIALIYVYRPSNLEKDLYKEEARNILDKCGYRNGGANDCVMQLICRLRESEGFPHEIGLFLGYPPEDVSGFIMETSNEAERKECKCVGHWKVYGDEKNAQKLFSSYKKCTCAYTEHWKNGMSIESLTVPV